MAGVRPGCVGVCGSGVMLRVSGCALLFSYVRNPRLPMLDERPPADAPARASAMAGAKATLAQKNSARMMRQFGSGLAIDLLTQNLRSKIWGASDPAEARPNRISGSTAWVER